MQGIKQRDQINKGKLSVLVLALAGALTAIGAAHAQTVSSTSGSVTWSSTTDMLIDSSGLINGTPTGVNTGAPSLGTLTNQGTIDATNIGFLNGAGNSIAQIVNETLSLIHGDYTGIKNSGVIDSISNSGTISSNAVTNTVSSTGYWGIYNDGTGTIGTITNNAGAVISGGNAESGIRNFGTIDVIINSGTISGYDAVFNGGSSNTLSNTIGGVISGTNSGVSNIASGAIGLLDNAGTIYGGNSGMVNAGNVGSIANSGTIISSGYGINNSGHIGSIDNTSTGSISAAYSGIANGASGSIGTISNSGTISGNYGINNFGSIISVINDSSGYMSGIAGGLANRSGATIDSVSNSGTIIGSHTGGVLNFGTIGTLTNAAGALISGTKTGLQNDGGTIGSLSNSGLINGATIAGISTSGLITSLSNVGTISGNNGIDNSGSIGTLNNTISVSGSTTLTGVISGSNYGFNNTSSGTIGLLNNAGTISGGNTGLYNYGSIGSVSNSGLISGGNTGINNYTGTISSLSNTGTISGGSNTGIGNSGGSIGSLSNSGLIKGGHTGIYNSGSIGNLSNDGTISASTTASGANGIYNRNTITALTNTNLISAYFGIGNSSNGTISALTNTSTGTIDGAHSGVYNNGTIGTLSNAGFIYGGTYGVATQGNTELLDNSGTISAGAAAVVLSSGGTIGTLNNSGLITAPTYAIGIVAGTGIGTLINTGTIAGPIENQSSTALNITGGSGTIFGTLTGINGGIGNITSTIGGLNFLSGNQLLNDNINVGSSTVTNSGVLQLNNPITITGNYVQDAGATLLIGVSSGATFSTGLTDSGYGRLVVNGDAVIAAGSAITLKSLGYSFAQGQRYVVVASNGSNTNYNASSLVYSATGYTVTASVQADSGTPSYSDLVLTLGSTGGSGGDSSSGDSSSTKPNNNATTSNASSALGGLFNYGGTDAALLAVFNPAAALGSTAAANKAGAQLSPAAVTGAATKAVDAATQAVSNVVASHLDGFHLAQGGSSSGVATGERSAEIALWGQIFGGRAAQGLRENVSGYHANYRGLLIGADGLVTDQIRAGALFSAAKTSVASDGDNTGSSADVNNYGLTAYATYTGTPWYVNVLAGAMRQQYSTVRTISYTGFSGVADGSFHGSQYISSVQAGYPLNLDAWISGATLTPIAGLSYSTLRQNGYTETGGNGAALSVNASSSNSLKSELGLKLENTYAVSYGKLLPSVQLGWRHEYRDSATQTGAVFVADSTGATAFVTRSTTPVANLGVLNLGVTLIQSNNLSLTGKYTLETGAGYTAQTGSVQVRWQY